MNDLSFKYTYNFKIKQYIKLKLLRKKVKQLKKKLKLASNIKQYDQNANKDLF